MKPYAEEMCEYLTPLLRESPVRLETDRTTTPIMPSRLSAKQRRRVEALSTERGYRPFQAWGLHR